ncbi:MAG TPA: twin-arginine translocase TatA/TatE family subunit [Acidimicrobiales bacterium]
MLSLSPVKLLVIVAVVILLLGPDKLPEVARKLGTSWQTLRRFQQRVESEVRDAIPDLPSTGDIARMARSPINVLNRLADRVENPPSDEVDDEPAAATAARTLIANVVNRPSGPPPPATDAISADPSLN